MDIGEEKRIIIAEPIEAPAGQPVPVETTPEVPVETPAEPARV